jgi:hypothetical protein
MFKEVTQFPVMKNDQDIVKATIAKKWKLLKDSEL